MRTGLSCGGRYDSQKKNLVRLGKVYVQHTYSGELNQVH
jgi:hypothetical protein